MSKGMKQKTAIITAFIRDKEILIFDEPTTGLDPLMRDTFVALINSERAKGKTIIFSTHIFLEAERCCDNVIFLDQGKIIKKINIESLLHHTHTVYRIGFNSVKDCQKFVSTNTIAEINKHQRGDDSVVVTILGSKTQEFLKQLTKINVKYFTEIKHSLAHEFKKTFSAIINSEKR
jgi:ABC-2 type transport system ATP-binding protein